MIDVNISLNGYWRDNGALQYLHFALNKANEIIGIRSILAREWPQLSHFERPRIVSPLGSLSAKTLKNDPKMRPNNITKT